MLYREPKLLKATLPLTPQYRYHPVSVLYREPKLLKAICVNEPSPRERVSVLYREPKLLKGILTHRVRLLIYGFSALP